MQNRTCNKCIHLCIYIAKMRTFVMCVECGKRRVVYVSRRLGGAELLAVQRLQEDLFFTCGSTLFTDEPYKATLVVREGIACESPIETTYYNGPCYIIDRPNLLILIY